MTDTEKEYAKSLHWIIFVGDFPLTEALNSVFCKEWIRECEVEKIFEVPDNQLTTIGKIVLKRLIFARDILGISLNYEVLIQVFQKVKNENFLEIDHQKILQDFRLQEALAKEDYETAHQLQNL